MPSNLLDSVEELQDIQEDLLAQQRPAAVMFVDLHGSTEYKERRGRIRGIAKTVTFNKRVSEIIFEEGAAQQEEGGVEAFDVVKYIGDEVMAYFVGDRASEAALEVAIAVQDALRRANERRTEEIEQSRASIGINTGDVLFAQYHDDGPEDPQGLAVDVAARITGLAKPEQVLVTRSVRDEVQRPGEYRFGEAASRDLKGITDPVEVIEFDWGGGLDGIRARESHSVESISAGPRSVERFIEQRGLFESVSRVDLSLYTFETLAATLRPQLGRIDTELDFRVLIRNPAEDPVKASHIHGSLRTMSEIMQRNEDVTFSVRFYDSPPTLRTYVFVDEPDDSAVGLCGIYRYDPAAPSDFVGAEDNQLVVCDADSGMAASLLDAHRSRFRYNWESLSEERAVIFDLDGTLIDTMQSYEEAWLSAFEQFDVTGVPAWTLYDREGEHSRVTAAEIYEEYRGEAPSDEVVEAMIRRRDEVLADAYEPDFFPGARRLVESLGDKVRLGLVTGSENLSEKFESEGAFLDAFDVVVSGADKSGAADSRNPYNVAVQRLNVPTEHCCVVENAPLGIEQAVDAGLPCFGVRNSSPLGRDRLADAGATAVYDDLTELRGVLQLVDANVPPAALAEMFT